MKTVKLGNVCEKIGSGATPRGGSEVYQSRGVALIRSQNVYNDGFRKEGLAYINDKHARELENVIVQAGDVLLNITGDSVARVCQVPKEVLPARVNQHVSIIRPHKDILDAKYLKYFLVSPLMQQYMNALAASGATRQALTKGMIEAYDIPAPPLPEQKAIASVLGALDDKIELNRQMNETLEAMARAIFKSWFVDFDPIPTLGPHREWQDSQVGKIPKGWRIETVVDIAELHRDIVNPGDFPDEFFEHFSIPAFDEGKMPALDLGVTIKSNKFLLPENCVLISKLNPRIPRVWFPKISKLSAIASTEFLVLVPKKPYTKEFIYSLCISAYFIDTFTSLVTGTSSSHQRVKPEDLLSIKIVCPTDLVLEEFTQKVQPLFMTIQSNNNQTHTLAVTRDTLLPKLLSGEMRVKDAEKFVAVA
jgi:type I restriction enzyme S subunit